MMTVHIESIFMRLIRRLLPFAIVAPPDGSAGAGTDATVADAANRGAKIIFVKPGTYGPVALASVVGAIIIGSHNALFDGGTTATAFHIQSGCSRLIIIGCQFKTTAGGGSNADGMEIDAGTDQITLLGCWFSGSDEHGLVGNTDGTDANHLILGCRFESMDSYGCSWNSNRARFIGNYYNGTHLTESTGDNTVHVGNHFGAVTLASGADNSLLVANGHKSTLTDSSTGSTVADNESM